MDKKKIIVFHPALAPYRIDLFNSIHEAFDALFYFNFLNVTDQKFDQESLKQKCRFKSNYLLHGFDLFGRSFRTGFIPIINKNQPDIILCCEYGQITIIIFLYKFFFRKRFKLYTISDDSVDNSATRKGLRLIVRNFISKNIDGIIFTSDRVSNWYKANVSNKTKILEMPIIHSEKSLISIYNQSIVTANANIKKYNLEGKKIILFVGRLVKVKNLGFLIRCFSKINEKDAILIIVGDGDLRSNLNEYVEKLGLEEKVIFTGRQEGELLYSWYVIAQIFILPSTDERFGAVVNEALVGGCFTLCSSYAGASSLINEDNGLLFNPYDEQDLIEKLHTAINNSNSLASEIRALRKSKMLFTFDEKIKFLVNKLNDDLVK